MKPFIQFGEHVDGYNIPVLNEREIRASAGILFLFILISLMQIIFEGNFLMAKYAVFIFLSDLLIRVIINPRYAPSLIIGRLIVRNQTPEYVGAKQKLFAWKVGIVIASIIFFLLVVANTQSEIIGFSCLICLIFLFFESAFGICIACKFYSKFYKDELQYCPGEVCDFKTKQAIQYTSNGQLTMILLFAVYIFLTVYLFNDQWAKDPLVLWDILGNL